LAVCIESPQPGVTTTTVTSAVAATSSSNLSDANRLDQRELESNSAEQRECVGDRHREAAVVPSGRGAIV